MGVTIFIVLTAALFSIYYVITIRDYFIKKKRWNQAIPAEAKIVSIGDEEYNISNEHNNTFLGTKCKASFYVNTVEYVRDVKIEKRKQKIQVGDRVEIRYCCNTKQEIEIIDEIEINESFGVILLGIFVLLGMLFVLLKCSVLS